MNLVPAYAENGIRGSYLSNFAIETEEGDVQKFEHIVVPELFLAVNENMNLFGQLRFSYDFSDDLEPGEPQDNSFRSSQSERIFFGSHAEVELRELYVDGYLGNAFYRLGKQQIVWGEADGLRVLDVINPFNYREFILPTSEDSRIPLWAANVEYPINDWMAQFVWILDQTYDQTPEVGKNSIFEFTSPRVVHKLPKDFSNASVALNEPNKPDDLFSDSDFGLRLSTFTNGWDISFNYFYHYHDSQVFRREIVNDFDVEGALNTDIIISPEYERTHLIGGTVSNAFGDITLRGEAAYSTDRFFVTNDSSDDDGVIESSELSSVVGLDYQGIRDVFLSGQLFINYVLDFEESLTRDQFEAQFTFLYEHQYINDRLKSSAQLIHSLNDSDGLLKLGLIYEYRSNILLKAGFDIFYGDEQGLFGQFGDNDRMTMGVEIGL